MKKNLFFTISFLVSCLLIMTSCSQDLDYKKACEEKDFVKAYEIVEKLKEKTSEAKIDLEGYSRKSFSHEILGVTQGELESKYEKAANNYRQAARYVILQEAIYVLESQGDEGLIRIVGICKEHNAEDWLYDELGDVAAKVGDKELTTKIEELNPNITYLTPEKLSISGPLNGYFEIGDSIIKFAVGEDGRHLSIRLKRIKNGLPKQVNLHSHISFEVTGLDENGTVKFTETMTNISKRDLIQCNLGEHVTIRDYFGVDISLLKCKKFTIRSESWNR